MNEKKTVLSVVLGVAIVAFITAIVSTLIDGFTLLIDFHAVYSSVRAEEIFYNYVVGILELVAVFIAVVFALVCMLDKKHRSLTNIVFAVVIAAYFVITAIILRFIIVIDGIDTEEYAMFTSYLANVAALSVSAIIASVSSLLLIRSSSKQRTEKNCSDRTGTNDEPQND